MVAGILRKVILPFPPLHAQKFFRAKMVADILGKVIFPLREFLKQLRRVAFLEKSFFQSGMTRFPFKLGSGICKRVSASRSHHRACVSSLSEKNGSWHFGKSHFTRSRLQLLLLQLLLLRLQLPLLQPLQPLQPLLLQLLLPQVLLPQLLLCASTAAAAAAAAAIAAAALQWLLLQQALRAPFYRARIVAIPWDVRTAHVPPSIGPSFEDGTVPKVIFAGAKGASGRALSRKVIFQALRRVLGMALS